MLKIFQSPDTKLQHENERLKLENARFLDVVLRVRNENMCLRDQLRDTRNQLAAAERERNRRGQFA
ncbi:hypothetical protein HK15_13130 [Acetobacter orientalis]|uniref:Uncharacterized protein n=1 Tax=Acetobacter orientalis TaxID=146474 RepID=A0A252B337_9PROT|nr:hypothetical protein [Acetobacter orientalis]OUI98788.1 hypothetical protein HK15_13130 [Acetobacter orientalis]